ncbi:MAG: ferritin-like domain-containing protein [Rhodoferax sp.]|nr:ferritin-like domain-containing protein [Rhodoferax sp.]
MAVMTPDLRAQALDLLLCGDPAAKAAGTRQLASGDPVDTGARFAEPPGIPGRPVRPALVPFNALQRRSAATAHGRVVLLHALAHIEFNAINLALDVVWRFAGLPEAFYRQWIGVAREEALHFELLRAHLQTLGHDYGDFPAHNGLWEMAEKTRRDPLARMALVPRTLEARGLDASPPMKARLQAAGDHAAAGILDIILRDEIGHVAVGNHWYRHLCAQRGLDPVTTYASLAREHGAPRLRGPFNLPARRAAGFHERELELLQQDAPA